MKTLIVVLTLIGTGAWAKENPKEKSCKANCSSVRGYCAQACESQGKNKKAKAACIQQACDLAVQHCEGSCKGAK